MKLPSALENFFQIFSDQDFKLPALFLDFDGTLAPIVPIPDDAKIPEDLSSTLSEIASRIPVFIISGRGLIDLMKRVRIPSISYAGSHGFELYNVNNSSGTAGKGEKFLPELKKAEKLLVEKTKNIQGSILERKKFSIAVHYRLCNKKDIPLISEIVNDVLKEVKSLKADSGKMVFDIKPDTDWHKGAVLKYFFRQLPMGGKQHLPVFLGDDKTDEDAFLSIKEINGKGIIVDNTGRDTEASFYLADTAQVDLFLRKLRNHLKTQYKENLVK